LLHEICYRFNIINLKDTSGKEKKAEAVEEKRREIAENSINKGCLTE